MFIASLKGFTSGQRFKDVVYNLFDAVMRSSVTYRQVTVWADGVSVMSDGLCDGVSYVADTVKGARVYYERVWSRGIVDLAAYGIIADGQEHGPALQDVLDYFAPVPTEFRFQAGSILLDAGHNFYRHTLRGRGPTTSILRINGQQGPVSFQGMTLSDLQITSRGLDQTIGQLPPGYYPGYNDYKGQKNRYFSRGYDGDGESVDPEVQAAYVVPDFFVRDQPLPAGTYPNATYPAGSYWESTNNPANVKRYLVQTSRAYSTNPYDHNTGYGLGIYSICDIRNVVVTGFAIGLNIFGDVNYKDGNAPNGYIADRCWMQGVSVQGCTFGWLFTGGDANQSTIIGCEARNVEGWGFMDNSLLGNHFYAPHVIDAGLGAYYVPQSSSYVTFDGWYAEQGNLTTGLNRPSRVYGNTTISGGIPGSGLLLFDNAGYANGSTHQKLIANRLTVNQQLTFSDGGLALYVTQNAAFLNGGNGTGNLFGFFKKNTQLAQNGYSRAKTQAGVTTRNLYESGFLRGAVYDINSVLSDFSEDDYNYQATMFAVGDVLLNQRYSGSNPRYWVCQQGGSRTGYSEGLTATCLHDYGKYVLSGPTTQLAVGDYITIGGVPTRIIAMPDATHFTATLDVTPTTQQAIAYPTPTFAAKERGTGTTAQRPTDLRQIDAGWDYWNTDNGGKLNTWSGTAWV